MNPLVAAILGRRSRRDGFTSTPVPSDILMDIVRCGLAAPSSKNARPWRFHVVTDAPLLADVASMVEGSAGVESYVPFDPATGQPRPEWSSTVLESAAILRQVPAAVFIENRGVFSGGRNALVAATPAALEASIVGYTFEVIGVGAAVENMWIAAVAHGLDAVFMGDILIAEARIRDRLKIERDLIGVLAIGFGQSSPGASQPRPTPQDLDAQVRWHE